MDCERNFKTKIVLVGGGVTAGEGERPRRRGDEVHAGEDLQQKMQFRKGV